VGTTLDNTIEGRTTAAPRENNKHDGQSTVASVKLVSAINATHFRTRAELSNRLKREKVGRSRPPFHDVANGFENFGGRVTPPGSLQKATRRLNPPKSWPETEAIEHLPSNTLSSVSASRRVCRGRFVSSPFANCNKSTADRPSALDIACQGNVGMREQVIAAFAGG
jgi:hypothetical protein